MPRQPRIEYKGAVYHVMSRGNHGEQIFEDDHDRKQFLATLGEACEKTGIEVYAFVLMSNHYHMVLGTPEGNLVKGMAWLQSTYTQRYNAYHKTWGHLFQGRYKSILVDKKSSGYFRAVCDYVHLNPARAGLVDSKKKKLSSYRWSSAWSLGRDRADDPEWLKMDRICGAYSRFTTEEGSERLAYLRYLESRVEEERREKGTNEDYASIRRGWVFGEESFKSQMKKLLINSMEDKKRSSHTGESRRLHDESIALALIKESMQLLELTQESLPDIKKGDTRKVLISWLIRKKTSMSLEWIANQLSMGSRANVSRGIQVVEKNTIESVKEKKKQLLEMYRCAR